MADKDCCRVEVVWRTRLSVVKGPESKLMDSLGFWDCGV